MRYSETCLFGEAYCHADNDGEYESHKVCVRINGNIAQMHDAPMVKQFMSEVEWIAFKNSVLAADEKMFGRRHANG